MNHFSSRRYGSKHGHLEQSLPGGMFQATNNSMPSSGDATGDEPAEETMGDVRILTCEPSRVEVAGDLPWYLGEAGIPPIWKKTRGSGATVAVLDGGVVQVAAIAHAATRSLLWDGSDAGTFDYDDDDHANFCASLIASSDDSAPGAAPECELVSLIVTGADQPDLHRVRMAMEWSANERIDVLSCSLTLPSYDRRLQLAAEAYLDAGGVIVASAGDDRDRPNDFPCRCERAIIVGGICSDGAILSHAHTGTWVDCLGPADELAVVGRGGDVDQSWRGETSGAAALVAGVIALAVASCKAAGLTVPAAEMKQLVHRTAATSGLIDAGSLINEIIGG
jgi:subtilisin family serine protease